LKEIHCIDSIKGGDPNENLNPRREKPFHIIWAGKEEEGFGMQHRNSKKELDDNMPRRLEGPHVPIQDDKEDLNML